MSAGPKFYVYDPDTGDHVDTGLVPMDGFNFTPALTPDTTLYGYGSEGNYVATGTVAESPWSVSTSERKCYGS